jgi:hypothetical protein
MLAIGTACAVAALPILILLMDKLQILRRPLGQRTPRDASLGHLLVWGVVALVLADWARVGRQAALLLIFGLAALGGLLDRAARHRRRILRPARRSTSIGSTSRSSTNCTTMCCC